MHTFTINIQFIHIKFEEINVETEPNLTRFADTLSYRFTMWSKFLNNNTMTYFDYQLPGFVSLRD